VAITRKAREAYQPVLATGGRFVGGERDYAGRLRLIENHVDFTDKTVLDLGCSSGFFTFSAAARARTVIGVDADEHLINRNIETAREHGFTNVSFHCRAIDTSLLDELPQVNIVLFLSVFHHMIAESATYPWNAGRDAAGTTDLLRRICRLGDTVVFEMGQPGEGFPWCEDIARLSGDLPGWIRANAFGDGLHDLQRLRGPAWQRFPFRALPWTRHIIPANRGGRKLLGLFHIDLRDCRDLYIGTRRRPGPRNQPASTRPG
jgi:SAM-dependent methyltransferase